MEDARHSSVLYICKYFVKTRIPTYFLHCWFDTMTAKVRHTELKLEHQSIPGTNYFFKRKKLERDKIGIKLINQISHGYPCTVHEKKIPQNEAKV